MIHIINKHTMHPDNSHVQFYIGRPNPMGNPYIIGIDGTREEVVQKYESWLKQQIANKDTDVTYRLRVIGAYANKNVDVDLICFCAPQLCHGEIIKQAVEEGWLE